MLNLQRCTQQNVFQINLTLKKFNSYIYIFIYIFYILHFHLFSNHCHSGVVSSQALTEAGAKSGDPT